MRRHLEEMAHKSSSRGFKNRIYCFNKQLSRGKRHSVLRVLENLEERTPVF